jgi:hypothetical protein
MPRPQSKPSAASTVQLQPKPRPEHPFAPAAAAAEPAPTPEAPAAAPTASVPAVVPQRRTAATAQSRNGADAASSTDEKLVKLSVRLHPRVNRAIKLYGVENDLSFQEIAMTALKQFFEREGRPLPKGE